MYILGVPTTVTIDDIMPLNENGKSIFAGVGPDKALWGMLVEKAFAKLHGDYEAIVAGDPRHSIGVLSGAPSDRYDHTDKTALELWNIIKEAEDNGNMVSASTPGSSNSEKSALGIVNNHVYTILSVVEVEGNRLLRIRNPWGRESYIGDWNDHDSRNWNARLR